MFSSLTLRSSTRSILLRRVHATPLANLTKLSLQATAVPTTRCFSASAIVAEYGRSREQYGERRSFDRGGSRGGRGGYGGGMSRGGNRGGRDFQRGGRDDRGRSSPRMQSDDYDAVLEDKEHEVDTSSEIDPVMKFQDLADQGIIDPMIIKTITQGMGYEDMTKVQRKTIPTTVAGADVLAQAKTGTGKTIAFLLPVIQRLITSPNPIQRKQRDIRCVIISPTRELALQIAKDAYKLTAGTDIVTQVAVGGTGKSMMIQDMRRNGCHLLIATPGRLHDLLTDSYVNLNTENVDTLVFDEGDTLLDQGFSEAIRKIVRLMPAKDSNVRNGAGRQTMIFSATMPQKVIQMVQENLRPDYKFLKMVNKDDKPVHESVKQHFVTCRGFENVLPTVYELCAREVAAQHDFKAIVFLPTTKWVNLAGQIFMRTRDRAEKDSPLQHADLILIHSKLTQPARTRAAERFRNAKAAIMFASDVVARGMDFPNVSHVIQVLSPSSKEQYIHRLGRTARGNNTTGTGYLVATEHEMRYGSLKMITKGLEFAHDEHGLHTPQIEMDQEQTLPEHAAEALQRVMSATTKIMEEDKKSAYTSLIGYFASSKSKAALVQDLNRWTRIGLGMPAPPPVQKAWVQKVGFAGVEGFNINERPMSRISGDPDGERGFGGNRGSFDRGGREGGFRGGDREGGFSRGDREGGFSRGGREGGFSRGGGREGGFSRGDREGGFRGGDRDGGFGDRPQRSRDDFPNWKNKIAKKSGGGAPWMGRGNVNSRR
ncbi:DEAD-domain-containing protein [Ascodesmis nigricans]|uniref:ATP-dependent RNA helicase n=1 Tax=Ascodesmis nigricans TaxID=341454 RepID=A0A4S2MQF7_9PEZI|nr:DEAD-domain-containing protein [Ascodesmis nigricans]